MLPYFKRARPDQIVGIIKAREPAGILISIGNRESRGCHLERKLRWVMQYSFYLNDREFGPMFVRVCPYLPFSVRVCLNQHHWLARQPGLVESPSSSRTTPSAVVPIRPFCKSWPDSLSPEQLVTRCRRWVSYLAPFFTAREREQGLPAPAFSTQVEYCDNLIFRRRAALDISENVCWMPIERIGQPDKITVMFGRKSDQVVSG